MTTPSSRRPVATACLTIAIVASGAGASAQGGPELAGPARDVVRAELLYPLATDPLLFRPLTPEPQAGIDVYGRDISGTAHAGVAIGDNHYGATVSVPLWRSDPESTRVDPRALRHHASLGFDLTNVLWKPKAGPALQRELAGVNPLMLSAASRERIATVSRTDGAVAIPWVVYVHADYTFNRAEYQYIDRTSSKNVFDTRLNDTASVLLGLQMRVKPGDPGYFVAASYTYSAVFFDAPLVDGVVTSWPRKRRGDVMRLEGRRLFPSTRVGAQASVSYQNSSQTKTADVAVYALVASRRDAFPMHATRLYAGLRVGHQTGDIGGTFATVFVTTVLGSGKP